MANNYMNGDIVLKFDDYTKLAEYENLHLQSVRRLIITIEVLDKNLKTIETIQGFSTSGNINISNSSLIRRTGSLSFVLSDYLYPKKESLLWMTNKIRVYVGIENLGSTDKSATHFCLGTFYITEPNVQIDKNSRSIEIQLEDYMTRWEQESLENKFVIESGTPLNTAVLSTMNFFGEFNTKVEFTDLTVPYKLEFNVGESVMSMIEKLRDLYMDWDCYYDTDGTFVFRKMQLQRKNGEPVSWSFIDKANYITSFKESFTYKNIKNKVIVIGKMDEKTGITPRAEVTLANEDSPFHAKNIGEKKMIVNEGNYSTESQCDSRARYELFKASNMQEKLDINTIPIYFLDGNDIVEVQNLATNEIERYVIDTISLPLSTNGEMSIGCHKLYYDNIESNSSLDGYRKSSETIIDGIQNKGWLSLSEQRVKDYYGLEGNGAKLIIRFEHQEKYGVTASTTCYTGNDTQVLTIDLADFGSANGENGDNGIGKADYSDRILGHEMVHVIMNNAMGAEKTTSLPSWFKEGCAEFIHGADERLKVVIVNNNNAIDDALVKNLIDRCVELINGATFQSNNTDYSAGYVIMKYIDRKIVSGKTMKNFMNSVKNSSSNGQQAITDAIIENTSFKSLDEFITDFKTGGSAYIRTLSLDVGKDEVDTGSIGGIDHRGSVALNAESIFDESKAIAGVSAVGFDVEFERI